MPAKKKSGGKSKKPTKLTLVTPEKPPCKAPSRETGNRTQAADGESHPS